MSCRQNFSSRSRLGSWRDRPRVGFSGAVLVLLGFVTWGLSAGAPATATTSLAGGASPGTTNSPRPASGPEPAPPPARRASGPETPAVRKGTPDEVNIALRRPSDRVENSNLLSTAEADASAKHQEFQAQLDIGWQQKRGKEFALAEKTFISLLNSEAPPELQRTALLELALMAQEQHQPARAQQVFAQYVQKYPDDPSVQEVLLRQGLLYRQMGAPMMALAKFYGVMTTSLRLKPDRLEYYQRLVLQAQTEIAETYYLQGKSEEAVDFLGRLLKLDNPQLNKAQILYKLVRSLANLGRHADVLAPAAGFVRQYPAAAEVPEVRFLLATALKKLGRNQEAMQQVLAVLESQEPGVTPAATTQADGESHRATRVYWQQRTGNEIGNELYKEGDYLNALEVYRNLAELSRAAAWQLPVWYQTGLVYERLQQPQMASETYTRILDRQKKLGAEKPSPSLLSIFEMARWRKDHLQWQVRAEEATARILAGAPPKADLPLAPQ